MRQRVENPDARGVGQQLEDLRDGLQRHSAQQPRAYDLQIGRGGMGIGARDSHHPLIYEQVLICQSATRPANIERIRVPDYDPVSVQARDGPAITPICQGVRSVIEVQHLTKRYGPFTAVDDVSFRVEKGEILGFLGPNGAGKTTTMRVLTGYMPATEGTATVAGYDVFKQPMEAKRRIGYLPETPPLYPDMTVREYLTFVAKLKMPASVSKAEREARIDGAMAKTHIADMAKRHCSKLSKGYKQRVGIAQALLHDPEVLILDEPTAGLDPKQIIETRDLIRGLAGNHTIVLSTHILPEVSQTCSRVVIINKGRVVAIDTPDNLTRQLKGAATLYVQVDAAGADAAAALSSVPGVRGVMEFDRLDTQVGYEISAETDRDIRRDIARSIVDKGWGLLELRPLRMSLEDIFLQLTTDESSRQADTPPQAPAAETEQTEVPNA